ncbi:hypothetical protein SMICM17S_04041 [Streptomyces microflavus]
MAMRTLEQLIKGYYARLADLVEDTNADAALALYLRKHEPMLILRDLLIALALLPGSVRSRFEDDLWDLWGLADKPRSIKQHELTWNFFKIVNPKWRVVAKEILVALLAPQHDRVLECALALRKNRSPRTCNRFLRQFTAWFNWLTANGVASLAEVTQEHCDRFAAEAQWYIPKPGAAPVQAEPETLAERPCRTTDHAVRRPAVHGQLPGGFRPVGRSEHD